MAERIRAEDAGRLEAALNFLSFNWEIFITVQPVHVSWVYSTCNAV